MGIKTMTTGEVLTRRLPLSRLTSPWLVVKQVNRNCHSSGDRWSHAKSRHHPSAPLNVSAHPWPSESICG